jgi:hypothetical protein
MTPSPPLEEISELAAAQLGAISREQALRSGISASAIARRLNSGAWLARDDGVYVLPGARADWLQAVMVACLATRGIASHLTAGRLWKLALPPAQKSERIDVLVSASRRPRSTRGIHVHRTRSMLAAQPVQSIPTAKLGATILQLAQVLGPQALAQALDSALELEPEILFWLDPLLRRPRRGSSAAQRLRTLVASRAIDEPSLVALLRSARLLRFEHRPGTALFRWPRQKVALYAFDPPRPTRLFAPAGWRLFVAHRAHTRWVDGLRTALGG